MLYTCTHELNHTAHCLHTLPTVEALVVVQAPTGAAICEQVPTAAKRSHGKA